MSGKVRTDGGQSDFRSRDLNDYMTVSCSLKFLKASILLNPSNNIPFTGEKTKVHKSEET